MIDSQTGIIFRETTFDEFILKESKAYFPVGILPTDRILDVGAHIGTFACRAKIECPKCELASVEPEASNFAALEQNAEKFGFDALRGAVVSDELEGTKVQIYVNGKKNNALHTLVEVRGRECQEVDGIGFSKILGAWEPTIVKCDIEGGEYSFPWEKLANFPAVRMVIMELHLTHKGHRDEAPRLVQKIKDCGFVATKEPKIGEKNWTTIAVFTKGGTTQQPATQ